MRLDRERLREIAGASFSALSSRGRLLFLASCAVVLVASWWGAQRFADHLLTQIPPRSGPDSPTPLTAEEMQEQVRVTQELNARIRAQREAAHAFARGELDDSTGAFAPIDWEEDGGPQGPPSPGAEPSAVAMDTEIDVPARALAPTRPEIPELALQSGVSGTVIVRALVGTDGRVLDTAIDRSIPMLNGAAENTVRRWRFQPALRHGQPVTAWTRVPVTFAR